MLSKGGDNTMYTEALSQKLKSARRQTGFTQREVSSETHIAQPVLALYETGKRSPDAENLGILADFYNVSADWLLGTKGGKQPPQT